MTRVHKSLLAASLTAGALAFTAGIASADIACTGNVCWHAHEHYNYPGSAHVVVHPDSWHWGANEHFTFREHEGRGYWHGDRWETW